MTTARDLILERFPSLSPRLQAAARFIVDHPNEVVIGSMRALAERSGAPPISSSASCSATSGVKKLVWA
jgi:DNA-binding MurR/RpiR family transcriptional regulator